MNQNKKIVKNLLVLINKLVNNEIKTLSPQPNTNSQFGFSIEFADEILGFSNGEEIFYLDKLAEKNILSRRAAENIALCPCCLGYLLIHRSVCPECKSPDYSVKKIIRHFKCGETDYEDAFYVEDGLVCPKCRKKLGHIGVDYDMPGKLYLCHNCNEKLDKLSQEYKCMTCLKTFSVNNAETKKIYSYTAGANISLATSAKFIEDVLASDNAVDPVSGLQTYKEYIKKVHRELSRRERYNRPVVFLKTELIPKPESRFMLVDVKNPIIRRIAKLFKENLRIFDEVSYSGTEFHIMLTETSIENCKRISDKLSKLINEYLITEDLDESVSVKITEVNEEELKSLATALL